MSAPTVMVIGTGRSGTSTISRLLEREFGVCMVHHDRPADEFNPGGYFEDQRIKNLIDLYGNNEMEADAVFVKEIEAVHERCDRWGIKAAIYKVKGAVKMLAPKAIIRATRSREASTASWVRVAESMAAVYGDRFSKHYWQRAVIERERMIERELEGLNYTIEINFDVRRSEEYVRGHIRTALA